MAEVEVKEESQPSNASDIVAKHFAGLAAPEPDAPQAPEADGGAAPEEAPFDPATIKIPNRQFSPNASKALEKFKDKTIADLATSYEEAERTMHSRAQEASDLRRQLDTERAARIAAEQFQRMVAQPQQTPQDIYQRAGVNLDEAIITDPTRVMATTLEEARRIAREESERAAYEWRSQAQAEAQESQNRNVLLSALEMARGEVGKLIGKEISIPEWQNELQDVARLVQMREPERVFDHKAYVETYTRLRGVPKVSVPAEGNPPVNAKPSSVKSERQAPTMTREEQQLSRAIRKAMGLEA